MEAYFAPLVHPGGDHEQATNAPLRTGQNHFQIDGEEPTEETGHNSAPKEAPKVTRRRKQLVRTRLADKHLCEINAIARHADSTISKEIRLASELWAIIGGRYGLYTLGLMNAHQRANDGTRTELVMTITELAHLDDNARLRLRRWRAAYERYHTQDLFDPDRTGPENTNDDPFNFTGEEPGG